MAATATVMEGVDLRIVPLSNLTPAPGNPRKTVGDVTDLAASMATHGILEPLIVVVDGADRRGDDKYVVVCGQRRLKAAKAAKLSEVPVIVRELDEKAMLEVMLIENLQREDLTPMEEALTFGKLVNDLGYSQRKLGDVVGKSQAHISKRLSLLGLPKTVQAAIGKGEIPVSDAVELARLEEGEAKEAFEEITHGSYASAKQLVDSRIFEKKRLERVEAVTADLTARGIKIVPNTFQQGQERIGPNAWEPAFKKLKVADHEKLDCHAVTISHQGEQIAVCTTPTNHVKSYTDTGKSQREISREKKEKAQRAALRARGKIRREHLVSLVTTRMNAGDRLQGIVLGFLSGANSDPAKIACDLLGLEVEKGQYSTDYRGALETEMQRGPEQLARVGLALSLGYLEENFDGWGTSPTQARYLTFLRKSGYKISAEERERGDQFKADKKNVRGK